MKKSQGGSKQRAGVIQETAGKDETICVEFAKLEVNDVHPDFSVFPMKQEGNLLRVGREEVAEIEKSLRGKGKRDPVVLLRQQSQPG